MDWSTHGDTAPLICLSPASLFAVATSTHLRRLKNRTWQSLAALQRKAYFISFDAGIVEIVVVDAQG